MKKFLLGAAAATLLFAGCAQNELLDGGVATPNDGKIRFSGTSGLVTTKAAAGNPYNSTADLQGKAGAWGKFTVSGFVSGGSALIDKQPVTFNGVSWEYNNEPYWPNSTMDFFAYANWDGMTAPVLSNTGITATGVEIAPDNGAVPADDYKQKDLLVAATIGATKEVRTLLNFKHALTQVVFKAGNINPSRIGVVINEVSIANVGSLGDMTVGTTEPVAVTWTGKTTTPAKDIVANAEANPTPTERRVAYSVAGISNYPVQPIAVADANTYSKYPRIQTDAEPNNNALILLPQNFKAWDTNAGTPAGGTQVGSYIKLTATIVDPTQVNATTLAAANTAVAKENLRKYVYAGTIGGNETDPATLTAGDVFIPVESLPNQIGQWMPGKRINYIITFGDSNSGSGGGGYDNNGDPILVPIRFRAVVEDWVEVDVPLLTATFEAFSTSITHNFINGYTNQLLNDIKAAAAPKVYQSKITLKGTTSATIGTNPDPASANVVADVQFEKLLDAAKAGTYVNAKFRPGSTLEYNLTAVTNLADAGRSAKIVIPNGWTATLNGATATSPVVLNVSADATLILTKIPTNGATLGSTVAGGLYPGYSYICQAGFIEDNLAAIEMNENYATAFNKFINTVYVKSTVPAPAGTTVAYTFSFSSEQLSKLVDNVFTDSKAIIDLSDVTGWGTVGQQNQRNIATWVPAGWKAEVVQTTGVATTYFPGDPILITNDTHTKVITFIKTASSPAHLYLQKKFLEEWLATDKAATDVFYYDNVDFDVDITEAVFTTTATITGGAKIYLKYPISNSKNSVLSWSYNAATGVYTKSAIPTGVANLQDAVNAAANGDVIYALEGANDLSTVTAPTGLVGGQKIHIVVLGTNVITLPTGLGWSVSERVVTYTQPYETQAALAAKVLVAAGAATLTFDNALGVAINFDALTVPSLTSGASFTVTLKNALTADKVTATGNWTYDAGTGVVTYTAP